MEKASTSREGTRPPARPRTSAAKTGKYNKPPRAGVRSPAESPASSRSSSTTSSRSSSTTSSRSSSTASSRSGTPAQPRMSWMAALRIWNRDHSQWCIPYKGSKEHAEVEKIRQHSKSQTTSLYHSTHKLSQSMRDDSMSKFRFT